MFFYGKVAFFFSFNYYWPCSVTQASDIHLAKDFNKINMKEQTSDIQTTVLQSHCDECQDCDEGDCSQSGHCRHSCSFHVYLSDNAFKMNN